MSDAPLKSLLAASSLARSDALLVCLYREPRTPKKPKEIRDAASHLGLRGAAKWNISQVLASASGLAISVPAGWELTPAGEARVKKFLSGTTGSAPPAVTLRTHAAKIANPSIRAFVEEAIACYENRLHRAAIVFSWIGALAVLYEEVVKHHLPAFNAEAVRRTSKWKSAKNADDLALMKEAEFLDILQAISVLGKSVKTELKQALDLRNGCGHPNSLRVAEHKAAAHIELLVLNVFAKYSP